uniref:Kinesin family member 15 n=1 Tax=Haplochromis burtoni TaxID=8153 RepID=A0A3Q2W4J1_HAPBU
MNSSGKGRAAQMHSDSIKVFVRVRPLTRDTGLTTDGDQNLCLSVTSPNTIRLLSKPEPRTFTYDHVADMDTTQDAVFSSVAKNIVESCMNGYNGTIFAYGQTGSGKTFTMLGPSELDNFTDDLRGVIPRSFEYLFFLINREVERSSQSKSFLCKCSFIEIYNEQIYDLLDTASASLFLRENIKKGVFVEGVVENPSLLWLMVLMFTTYIIANVHPGSKCFGETLSTLQFAQRAKLIKNKAVINEDTQGNVKQLQAEVKKLKEQLAQALTSQGTHHDVSYKVKFMSAVRLWKKQDEEKKALLTKVAQLEEAWAQKDKFIHSSRMIVRFREDHISRLEKKLKAGENSLSDKDSQALIDQLKEEIKILKDQVEHHPKMTRYAAENYSLREENRQLRSLESVVKAQEVAAQVAVEIEEAFQKAVESERPTETSVATDTTSAATIEKLNAKLLQRQSDLTGALQAFEEYKDVTKKQMAQLESEKRYLEKSNKHLEKILEATNAYNKQEVSELNRIHVETLKILSTPTRGYNLRSRLVPLSSPEHLNGMDGNENGIWSEQPPSDMTEMALTEELRQVQVKQCGFLSAYTMLEWEQLLEQHRTLQDSFDQLQAEAKFEADQSRQQLDDRQKEIDELKAEIMVSELHTNTLVSQLKENKESTSKELLETVEQNTQLKKQVSDLITQNQQQVSTLADLEQNLTSAKESIKSLEQKTEQDKDVVLDLINQTRDLRSELSHKDQTIVHLNEDIRDITAKCNAACCERDNIKEQKCKMQEEICDLKETLDRRVASNKIEVMKRLVSQAEHIQTFLFISFFPLFKFKTPCTPGSFNRDLSQVLEIQERELENRRSSMMTMEILLSELNAERAAKNEEIERLKTQLSEKEMVRMEIQALLDKFYTKQNQMTQNGNNNGLKLNEAFKHSILKELDEERTEKVWICSSAQESMLVQSQTCIQELTTELRNRCLELRETNQRIVEEEKLIQVKIMCHTKIVLCIAVSFYIWNTGEVGKKIQLLAQNEENIYR